MTFWGAQIKPGQKHKVDVTDAEILHISQVCLEDLNTPGKTTVSAIVKGAKYMIAVLEKGKRDHDSLDLFFEPKDTTFTVDGPCEVHLLGYLEPRIPDDEDAAPAATAKAGKPSPRLAAAVAATAAAAKTSAKDDEDEDEEEESEEEVESEEEAAPAKPAQKTAEPQKRKSSEMAPPGSPAQKKAKSVGSPAKSPAASPAAKSPAASPASSAKTPGSPKAAKSPAASPASSAKSPGSPKATSAETEAYVAKLVDHLQKNGKTNIGILGSTIQRPKTAPKMKALIEQHKDKFVLVGDAVEAKK